MKDFYHVNLSYSDKAEEDFASPGGYSGKLSLSMKCISDEYVKVVLCCTDMKFLAKTNEKPVLVDARINYANIQEKFIVKLEQAPKSVDEGELILFFYENLFRVALDELIDALEKKLRALPDKGFVQVRQVFAVIQSFCRRAVDSMRNSCMDASIGAEHKLLSQMPIADFLQSYGSLSSADEQNTYLWVVGFVYRLRNALFHEIIDPLDPEWQLVFKNAYLVLKQVVDANISRLKKVSQLLELAPLLFWDDFTKAPPPEIPIENYDGTTFSYDKVDLQYYNQTGAKIHICSTIVCKGKSYHVECDVKWNESLKEHKVKNVQIQNEEDLIAV